MKKLVTVLILLILIPGITINAQMNFEELPINDRVEDAIDKIPSDTKDLMWDLGIEEISSEAILNLSFSDFIKLLFESLKNNIKNPLKYGFVTVAVIVMCALLENFKNSFSSGSINSVFSSVSTIAVALIISDGTLECIQQTCSSVKDYNTFMLGLIPVYSGAIAVAGSPIMSGTYGSIMFFICQVIANVITSTIMPLLNIYFAVSIVSGIDQKLNLNSICEGIKKAATWVMTFLMTVFTGIMSIQSIIAAGSDNVATKTGKYILSSFVPVVGSALSEVLMSVQGSVKLLKNCVGGYCVIALIVTFLPILIKLLIWKFTFFLAQIFSDILNIKSVSSLTKSIGCVFSILIAVVLVFSLLIIISTTLMMLLGQGRI